MVNTHIRLPRQAIGVIAPSANVVVEWTAIHLMRAFPEIGLHFARTPMRGTVDPHPNGYDTEAMLNAAGLLADAAPSVIVWAGSKGVLVGLEEEEALCSAIKIATGVEVTTPTIALRQLWARGARRVALVTPYTTPYQNRLIEGLERLGIACVSERHADISDNLAYAEIKPEQIRRMIRDALSAAETPPEYVLAWCTNFAAAALVDELEREFGVPVIDATLLGMRQAFSIIDVDPSPARAWGRLFQ
jgi:maleate isomerase